MVWKSKSWKTARKWQQAGEAADVHGEREHVPILVVDRHRLDEARRDLHERTRERSVEVADPALDRLWVEVGPSPEVANNFGEDLG